MEPMLDEFRAVAEQLIYRAPRISMAVGEGPEYWVRQVRETVRFGEQVAAHDGAVFVELGPDGSLARLIDGIATLDRDDETRAALTALAELHVRGVNVDWPLTSGQRVLDLPTYAFQRQRYWIDRVGDGHPLLGSAVRLAESDGVLFTSTVSRRNEPWLRDQSTLPPAAFAEMALAAADEIGHTQVEELTVELLPALLDDRALRMQTWISDGRLTIHVRYADGEPWTRVAAARLSTATPTGEPAEAAERAQRSGDDLFADVALDDSEEAARFALHPALLSAALDVAGEGAAAVWRNLSLHASNATELTVRLTPSSDGVLAITATDATGQTVLSGSSVTLRTIPVHRPAGALDDLFTLTWTAIPTPVASFEDSDVVVFRAHADGDDDPLAQARVLTAETLQAIHDALTADHTLIVHTGTGLAAAAVSGLVRSAQSEHPGRFVLVESDGSLDPQQLAAAAGLDEPRLRYVNGRWEVPRLTRVTSKAHAAWDPEGTVLITGASGGLAGILARHLVAERGVRRLLLLSRTVPAGIEELTGLGAHVDAVSCDVSDRAALAHALGQVPPQHPLTAVIHTAGVVDDGVIESQTPQRLDTVLRPKADGAWHLHELTQDNNLAAFIMYSSAAAVLGSPGQSNYAAANAFVDALAEQRRAQGLPGLSLAWGMWEQTSGMTAQLTDTTRDRLRRSGIRPITAEDGMRLFDLAAGRDEPLLVAAPMDPVAGAELPALLRSRHRPAARRTPSVDAGRTPAEREQALLKVVRDSAATVLGHADGGSVGAAAAFKDLGVDSLTAVELRNSLAKATGLRLPATLVFDYPTPAALAVRLGELITGTVSAPARRPSTAVAQDEPLAIVGMACRLPGGVSSPEDLWRLVESGTDAISGFPTDRGWPDVADNSYSRQGGFLDDAGDFDAPFFGISPREARAMDPQQRLVLEAAWEAFERAGIEPGTVRGSDTGVFMGAYSGGYGIGADLAGFGATSGATSVLSGRVSYFFGLEGPAVTVDTACSSSLVALHQAGQALRQGECSLALVGGVTVMATPDIFVEFSRQRGLAADGRCKAFGDTADGTGWSEGVGVLLVERLSDAERNGHRVLAVVRSSAVNQDGASNGLTAPNGPSQQRVIQAALHNAHLTPADVDVVEAHGTGTTLGDPIEAQAVIATYGQDRDRPLLLGSLKSNVGHTQAAAGVSGVIKMVMALQHGVVPRTLHVDEPSRHVDWTAGAVRLVTENQSWPDTGRPRRAAVSAFGVSGTNAHVILESSAAPSPTIPQPPSTEPMPLVISAKTPGALADYENRLRAYLTVTPGVNVPAVASTLAVTRSLFEHRAVLLGDDTITGTAITEPRVVFVFPGQGWQWLGMGLALRDSSVVFAERMAECAAALSEFVDWDLFAVLDDPAVVDRVDVVQPACWAVMVSLAAVWQAAGVHPNAVVGHSQGEIAAACVAGAISLQDAARVVALRSHVISQRLAGHGAMASVTLPADQIVLADGVWIAAYNGPASTVIAGDPDAVEQMLGDRVRKIAVDYASHTPHVKQIQTELLDITAGIGSHAPTVPWFSTVDGAWVDGPLDRDYWYRNLRQPVGFHTAVEALRALGETVFVEVSASPVLLPAMDDAVTVATLRRDDGTITRMHTALAEAHVLGVNVDWPHVIGDTGRRTLDLPTYAFQHHRYWATAATVSDGGVRHPLLNAVVELPGTDGVVLTGRVSLATHPWLADHQVRGDVLLPGTGFVELVSRAAAEVGCDVIDELVTGIPLVLPPTGSVQLSVSVSGDTVTVHSKTDGSSDWTRHATATISASSPDTGPADLTVWPPAEAQPVDVAGLYERMAEAGYEYGPAFQGLQAAWRDGDTVYAEAVLAEEQAQDAARFTVHPALLDAALHACMLHAPETQQDVRLPFSWNQVRIHATGPAVLRVAVTREADGWCVRATDDTGGTVATIGSLITRPVTTESDDLFTLTWTEVSAPEGVPASDVVVFTAHPDGDDPLTEARALTTRTLQTIKDGLASDNTVVVHTGTGLASAAVSGLIRSAQSEHPGRFVLVESNDPLDPAHLNTATGLDEPRLRVTDGRWEAPRLTRAHPGPLTIPDTETWQLQQSRSGTLQDLTLTTVPQRPLQTGEVRIAVRAAGLNFRDVVVALGMVDDTRLAGGEAAGVVVEVGSGVPGLVPGDRVFGLVEGGFGPVAVADHRTLAVVPEGWSFAAAASVPVVFATAYYGLVDLAGLSPGEAVLIHAATGGVGMAATQIARHLGAEVYATASVGKQRLLRAAGMDETRIADSRTTAFRGTFSGIDVVLNSLSGEFVDASLDVLAPGGRFIEMGKTDIRTGLDVFYRAFDLMDAGPDRLREIMAEVLALFERGVLQPLPVKAWDIRQAREAFSWMSRARHTGKNVLTIPQQLDPDGTVLITGGSGVLAGILARHLVAEQGVRRVLLLSRSTPDESLINELIDLGAQVDTARCDVSDRAGLEQALAAVSPEHPLTAVIHTAGALDDGVIEAQTPERLDTVLRPKADAAWHLHELTKNSDLAAFVVYSSAAGVLGAAGQGNYAAANAFLDALAEQRHAEGLPALSLAWGLWEEASGLTAKLTDADHDRIRRSGQQTITAEHGIRLYDTATHHGHPLLIAAPIKPALGTEIPALLRGLATAKRPQTRIAAARGGASALQARLDGLATADKHSFLLDIVLANAATVLGHHTAGAIAADKPFKDLGIDSLTAVELRNSLAKATGLRLPATLVFDYPTPDMVAARLAELLTGTGSATVRKSVPVVSQDEPLAIVGMACRLPGGVSSPEDLWRLVESGTDAISDFPTDRGWADVAGAPYSPQGGFLDAAADFDATFFGISPREALAMDPQQRLVLEASWEAFERAGIEPGTVRGSDTGVFMGAYPGGYGIGADQAGFGTTAGAGSVLSGRVSYLFGLEGPAVTVDTACSSSLVALHQAGHALRQGECSLALVGGATVMGTPDIFAEFSRQGGLASDGRCKAFGDDADGTGWGEGVGILLVERLSDAQRHGHRVLAVVRGSAVNQDGASNGLTAPNGPSQQRVIQAALAHAGLAPHEVDVVEAHGTGTRLGDPIEAQAVIAAYGQNRDEPLLLGSVKSNVGHTQAAAGVAGVIKMVMALRHGVVPRTLHADQPSRHVDWTAGAVRLATENQPWPAIDRPRRGGVSSFGISGTNAHVILEGVPEEPAHPEDPSPLVPLVISAKTPAALSQLEDRLRAYLTIKPETSLAAVASTLAETRSLFEHRAVLLGDDTITGTAQPNPRVVFVFSGQGSQRAGMGDELAAAFPVFAKIRQQVWDLLDVPDLSVDDTGFAQPALFALQVALFGLLESWGVRPDALIGHSIGELAAGYLSGIWSLEDACTLVSARARLMQALPQGGVMVAVPVSEQQARAVLTDGVEIAAVNGPSSVVLSGDEEAVLHAAAALGGRPKRLATSHAFHSARMEPMLDEFQAIAEQLTYQTPRIPMTVGDGPEYWVRQVRETVRFGDQVAAHDGAIFVELGPDRSLSRLIDGIATLDRQDEPRAALTALAELHVRGVNVDWPLTSGQRVLDLPTYAFQRRRYWTTGAVRPGDMSGLGLVAARHPMLGAAVPLPGSDGDGVVLTGRLSLATHAWLADHAVRGSVLLPGTGFVELVLRAAVEVGCDVVDELVIESPLVLPEAGSVQLSVSVDGAAVTVFSRTEGADAWTRHVMATISSSEHSVTLPEFAVWPPAERVDVSDLYDRLAAVGYEYGPAFQGLQAAWRDGDTIYAEVALADEQVQEAMRFAIHPALLDAALHACLFGTSDTESPAVRLPFSWNGIQVAVTGATRLRVAVTPVQDGWNVRVADENGRPVATLGSLITRPLATDTPDLFTLSWTEVAVPEDSPTPDVVVIRALPDGADPLAEARVLTAQVLSAIQAGQAGDGTLVVRTGTGLASAAVSGLVRSAQSEHPGRFVLVESDEQVEPEQLASAAGLDEPRLRYVNGRWEAPRLLRVTAGPQAAWDPEGTVLITGASGGLAGILARHLVAERGVRRLLLLSRTTPAGIEELTALGAHVDAVSCDVSDRDALAQALGQVSPEHPLTAVIHTAGVVDDGVIESQTPQRLDAVLRPKADGAWHLHELTRDADLAAFIVYSSAAGVLGAPGQGNYAAANAFVDALAEQRRADGRPGLSLAWGMWEDSSGMTAQLTDAARDRMRRSGLRAITAEEGMRLFDMASSRHEPLLLAAPNEVPALLRPPRRSAARRAPAVDAGLTPAEREQALLKLVRDTAAVVLGYGDGYAVPVTAAFKDLGVDSLTAVELRNGLAEAVGLRLPATLVFDYPTPATLAVRLGELLTGSAPAPARRSTAAVAQDEPLAIVGMACRLPGGVSSPEDLWRLVESGTDAIAPFPTDRGWPDVTDTSHSQHGGFLHTAADFDAAFFGISPREALAMDPQQRLILEASWEAFERAGIDPADARGTDTGVFMGAFSAGYDADRDDSPATAGAVSVLSGRISYFFGLEGPAMTVDTACSSSLVALHQAGYSLRQGECSMALVGGVTVMATPRTFVEFSRQGGLASDGRCKAFGDTADGTGWSEGVGVLVVERLSDARAKGHRVLAVVRSSAVNQDGASNGLTAPNGPSQQRVIQAALSNAGLAPHDVDVVEAHGTGTTLGDPIEAQAVIAAYGQDREQPLLLGSIKSNVGHTQAAAGVSGVIKMVMALRHGVVPRTLHADQPSRHVDWTAGAVHLVTENQSWPETGRPRRAAVSSFGISGTNAHVILEGVPEEPAHPEDSSPLVPLVISAKSPSALSQLEDRLRAYLAARPETSLGAVASTLTTRSLFEHRAVLLDGDVVRGVAEPDPRVVFVFSGQGSQRAGMGDELAAAFPVFAKIRQQVWELLDVPDLDVDETGFAQPALFALQVALFGLFESWGVRPDALIGHSIGELAAGYVSGIWSLEDACTLVSARARLMQALPQGGVMVAVPVSEQQARAVLTDGVEIAAVNGPSSVVLSGDEEAVLRAAAALGGRWKRLATSHAFHSARMEPMLDEFQAIAEQLTYQTPRIPMTVGDGPEYWVRQVRETVRFGEQVAAHDGAIFVELGPDRSLARLIDGIATLDRDDEPRAALTALAELHVRGVNVDWPLTSGQRVLDLPTYAFQRERYWATAAGRPGDVSGVGLTAVRHPLLGAATALPGSDGDGVVLTGRVSLATHAWLADHAVRGSVLLPGTGFVELVLRAAAEVGCDVVDELVIESPLVLLEDESVQLSVSVSGDTVTVFSRASDAWTRHVTATISTSERTVTAPDFTVWPPAGSVDVAGLYDRLAAAGYEYGPAFQGLQAAWRDGDTVYAEVGLADEQVRDATQFAIHPALLDAALHACLLHTGDTPPEVRLPFSWNGIHVYHAGSTTLRVAVQPVEDGWRIQAADDTGRLVATVDSLITRPVTTDTDDLYVVTWTEVPVPDDSPAADVAVLTAHPDNIDPLTETRALTTRTLQAIQAELTTANTLIVHTGTGPASAAVSGLVRSAQSEHPGRFILVESDDPLDPAQLNVVAGLDEPRLRVTDGRWEAPRLTRAQPGPLTIPDAETWQLRPPRSGTLQDLTVTEVPQRPLRTGEVRIAVRAAGLNFRDVLITLGKYPGGGAIGSEAAGVVLETGAGVDDLAPGDRVFGLVEDGFAPTAVTQRRLLGAMPDHWSFTTAASVPIVFATAYYGLVDLAGLSQGESVLIHAAAGGVGMAATQIARHLGADIYATASTGKHHLLRTAGIDDNRIADSRTTAFRDTFGGIDVVLNSLSGEFVDASLDVLAPGGRFIEMGKTDIRGDLDVIYRAFDLLDAGPDRLQQIITELLALFDQGVLQPLPVKAWDIRQAREAFSWMSRARHTGKNVLTIPQRLDPDGTVLITGGSGVLAGILARHLVAERGVRRLLLLSRRTPEEGLIEDLVGLGAHVDAVMCDVSDREGLALALAGVPAEHPLTGVVHTAGVLDDGVIEAQTSERLDTVLRPKADAAWHLHELTKHSDLAAFVVYSSAAGVLGAAGQGNYAAANAFLDALAEQRQAEGLPALSLAWGLWEEASGLTAKLTDADHDRIRRSGQQMITAEHGMRLYDDASRLGEAVVVAAPMNPAPAGEVPALMRSLHRPVARRTAADPMRGLAALPPAEREQALLAVVSDNAAVVLGYAEGRDVTLTAAFKDLGVDSLTAVELRNTLAKATGLRLPATIVFDYPTPGTLAARLGELLAPAEPEPVPEEQELRRVLAGVPMARFREAGVLDTLLRLAGVTDPAGPGPDDDAAVDAMDTDALIKHVLEGER
ncbi:SDR family NAD(P)-dependent oxidoreductase [Actinoplanes sp. NPDC051470]|uniref:SDR family NAD(P)-dependent oxidoreductase n=1 Tax=Actinoplanes sp. NPDC051470 TaxID=3157224 RepID=UPI003446913E